MSPESNSKAHQAREPLTIEAEAQQVLDELLTEKLIPFALNVGKITKGEGEYTIHFYDSRIHSARVPLTKGHSFKDLVKSAVLARVEKMSGPLKTEH
jgi:hypothetical protein